MKHELFCANCGSYFHLAKDCPWSKFERSSLLLSVKIAAAIFGFVLLTNCATSPQISMELVTKAMVSSPPEPPLPAAENLTQRDIALYLVQIRSWGRQMKLQLNAIELLLSK